MFKISQLCAKSINIFLLAVPLAAFAAEGSAAAPEGKSVEKIPAPVQSALSGGMKLETKFEAAGGLTGWLLSQGPGNNTIVFTPPGGEVLIAGNMIDASGKNLTKRYLEQYEPTVDYSKMWGELEKSGWLAEGAQGAMGKDVKSVIYVLKDPNCGYCHVAWQALQAYEKVGLQVRWVPVAFLSPDSTDKAASLLSAKNPEAAIKALHNNWGQSIPDAAAPTKEGRAKLDLNNKLMKAWGFMGTPAVIYKDKSGKALALKGMFRLKDLPDITGLPAQRDDNPALAKFR